MKRATILLALIWTLLAPAALAGPTQCIPERSMPPIDVAGATVDFAVMLDGQWDQVTTKVGHVTTDRGRPEFCFAWEPLLISMLEGPKRILGTYDKKTNRAQVFLTPTELGRDGVCVIRHEMLHALLGRDERKVLAAQDCTVAAGGGL